MFHSPRVDLKKQKKKKEGRKREIGSIKIHEEKVNVIFTRKYALYIKYTVQVSLGDYRTGQHTHYGEKKSLKKRTRTTFTN